MYEKFKQLLDERKTTIGAVARATKIDPSTLYNWRNGNYTPKREKIETIAEHFGVPVEYFYGEEKNYYINDEVSAIAQDIYERPDLKILFSAVRDISREDMLAVISIAERLKNR